MSTNRNDDSRHPSLSGAAQVLAHAQAGREIVQDFVPLAESLKWHAYCLLCHGTSSPVGVEFFAALRGLFVALLGRFFGCVRALA